jgi:hypothetical protein
MSQILKNKKLENFYKDGFLILRNFYNVNEEILEIKKSIYEIIGIVANKYKIKLGRSQFNPKKFDEGILKILAANRIYISEIYDAVKQIPAFIRLVSSEKNQKIYKFISEYKKKKEVFDSALSVNNRKKERGTERVREKSKFNLKKNAFNKVLDGIAGQGFGIRMNIPGEKKFLANWHQDYSSQLRSLNGVVFWSPLVEINNTLGPVKILVGSHREGLLPVYSDNSPYGLVLQNEKKIIKKYQILYPLTKPGDLILMDYLTVHSSGKNLSNNILWSMQFRFFDYLEPSGILHGWKGNSLNNINFKNIHPKMVKNEN